MGSNVSIAQADVKSHFVSLPILRVVRWLLARGVNKVLLSAILRAQLFTAVVLCFGQSQGTVSKRSRGGLTGSVVAILLTLIPVETTLTELSDSLLAFGIWADHCQLLACSWLTMFHERGLQ